MGMSHFYAFCGAIVFHQVFYSIMDIASKNTDEIVVGEDNTFTRKHNFLKDVK